MVKIRENEFGVEKITLTKEIIDREHLEKWGKEFKLGTAGYRDNLNPKDLEDPEKPFNQMKMLIVAEARARVIKEKYGDGLSLHVGGEVRPHTQDFIQMFARVYASHGITVHLRLGRKKTAPIWYSSFGTFYHSLTGGENFTASHSQSFKGGWKPMDGDGKQLLGMAREIEDKVREIIKPGTVIKLSPLANPLIRYDFSVRVPYIQYLKTIISEENLEIIKKAHKSKAFRVIISPQGGSMGYTSKTIFESMGISVGRNCIVNYRHYKESSDFHGIGIVKGVNHGVDPGKWQIYKNLGAQDILHDDLCKLFMIWDPDGDRFNIVTKAPINIASQAAAMGLDVEYYVTQEDVQRLKINFTAMAKVIKPERKVEWENAVEKISENGGGGIPFEWFNEMGYDSSLLSAREVFVYFKPNQIYFMLLAFQIENNKKAGLSDKYGWLVIESYPTSRSLSELAENHGIKVLRTPVGFKHFGGLVKDIEGQIEKSGEEGVIVKDILGNTIPLPDKPRVLLMCEESGGAAFGGSQFIKSKKGVKSLAIKEKDGMQIGVITMVLGAKICIEEKSFAEYYIETMNKEKITYRHYDRQDIMLYDESIEDNTKREKAKQEGIVKRDRIVGFMKSLASAKKSGKISVADVEKILNSYTNNALRGIVDIYWAGDGTLIEFKEAWFELRASGTDAVLRYYIEGKDSKSTSKINNALMSIDGFENECYKKYMA